MPIIPLLIAGMLCLLSNRPKGQCVSLCMQCLCKSKNHVSIRLGSCRQSILKSSSKAFMQDLNIGPIILHEVRWGAVHVVPIPKTRKLTS